MNIKVVFFFFNVVVLFQFGKSAIYSFRSDYVLKVHFRNLSNLDNIRKISFVGRNGYRDSVDLLELVENRTSGLFLINKNIINEANRFFKLKKFPTQMMGNDLDKKIKLEKSINRKQYFRSRFQRTGRQKTFYYMRYDEMKNWLNYQAKRVDFIKLEVLGHTEENRQIILVKASKDETKPILWIDAGIHAREWISPSTAIFLIDKLMESSNRSLALLDNYQIYILPLINPDGYEYTHRVNRMWRKNRAQTNVNECKGVDLNRNYPYHWGGNGASPDPCSRIYQGSTPSSENETKAIVRKLRELKFKVKLFITLHSFGQYIMSPYGYSRNRFPRQYYKLMEMGASVSAYLRETYGRMYQVGSSANLLYEASGASDDFAAGELRIPYSYTMELPDRGRYGFLLPPTYIKSVGNQLWDALYIFTEEFKK